MKVKDVKAFPQMSHLKASPPCCGSPTSDSEPPLGDTVAWFCLFFKKASLRLAFLLRVDGLAFFLALPGLSEARPLSLASREKEKVEGQVEGQVEGRPTSGRGPDIWLLVTHNCHFVVLLNQRFSGDTRYSNMLLQKSNQSTHNCGNLHEIEFSSSNHSIQ